MNKQNVSYPCNEMLLIIKANEVLIQAIPYMILDNMLSEKS